MSVSNCSNKETRWKDLHLRKSFARSPPYSIKIFGGGPLNFASCAKTELKSHPSREEIKPERFLARFTQRCNHISYVRWSFVLMLNVHSYTQCLVYGFLLHIFNSQPLITPTYCHNSHSCMIIMQAARIIAICVPITAALWSAVHVIRDSGMELAVINSVNSVSIQIYKVKFFSLLKSTWNLIIFNILLHLSSIAHKSGVILSLSNGFKSESEFQSEFKSEFQKAGFLGFLVICLKDYEFLNTYLCKT